MGLDKSRYVSDELKSMVLSEYWAITQGITGYYVYNMRVHNYHNSTNILTQVLYKYNCKV